MAAIADATGDLLELVNYNVEGQQYVCTGTLVALDCLAAVTSYMAKSPKVFQAQGQELEAKTAALIKACVAEVAEKPFPITLKRSAATIPLEGIDVPFHSSFLLAKMAAFRKTLLRYISVEAIDPQRLIGKYVSNVTGKPFDISYEAIKEVYKRTNISVLRDLVEGMAGYPQHSNYHPL